MRNLAINWKKVLGFGLLALILLPIMLLGGFKTMIDNVDWQKEVIQCYDWTTQEKTGDRRCFVPATEDMVKKGSDSHVEFHIVGNRVLLPGLTKTYSLALKGGPVVIHNITLEKTIYIQGNHFAYKTEEGLLRIHHPLGTIITEMQLPEGATNIILADDGVIFIKREGADDVVYKKKFDSEELDEVHRGSYLNDIKVMGNFLFIRSARSYSHSQIREIHHKSKEESPHSQ